MGGKSDAPPTPDYMGIAQQQGQISKDLLQQQTTANRPNTTTPYGSTMWNYNPKTGMWSGNEKLSAPLQQLLNTQEGTANQQARTASGQAGAAGSLFNQDMSQGMFSPLNYNGVQQVHGGNYYDKNAQDAVWNEFQTMQKPLQDQQMEAERSQLEGQGLREGDAAYDNAIRNLGNTQYQQQQAAEDQAVLAGEQEAQAMQGMDVQAQNQGINLANDKAFGNLNLLNGLNGAPTNVQGPTSIQGTNAGVAQTPDLMGAAQSTYGANLNATNAANQANGNLWSGLGTIAGGALMFF